MIQAEGRMQKKGKGNGNRNKTKKSKPELELEPLMHFPELRMSHNKPQVE